MQYDWDQISLYAYAAQGSKAGGYNPQIFATIMQNKMMTGLMADMGISMPGMGDAKYTRAEVTEYKPESAWTYEIGMHAKPYAKNEHRLLIDGDLFYSDMYNQQVTVFPDGKTTGRMMANAARSRAWGAEATLAYYYSTPSWRIHLRGAYGFTDARFIDFDDGIGDYAGKVIPYAPRHTVSLLFGTQYIFNNTTATKRYLRPQSLEIALHGNGQGDTYWNEDNTYKQPFYAILNGTVALCWQHLTLTLWGKNLTNTRYDTFFFVSMSHAFLQRAKPIQWGVSLSLHL